MKHKRVYRAVPGGLLRWLGSIRIEDTVVVTAAGCGVLTPATKELREI